MTRAQRSGDGVRVVGYVRVSTEEQADSRAGLESQRTEIASECERRSWVLLEVYADEGVSGRSLNGRHALSKAVGAVESGEADALMVAKLDRLSRSLLDFAALMARANKDGWNLVALDLGIDLATPAGEFMANVMASAAQWERRIIGQRTRDALAQKRAAGVRLGRPPVLPDEVVSRILAEREEGESLRAIAARLNADGIPTAHGGARWYGSTVRSVLARAA